MPIPITLRQVMTELGPLLDAGEITEVEKLGCWVVVLEDDIVLYFDYDDPSRQLFLSAEVAPVPAERKLELFDLLLRYNSSTSETGGLRMAMDGKGENIELSASLSALELEPNRLLGIVLRFLEARNAWREKLLTWAHLDQSSAFEQSNGENPLRSSGLRV